MPFKSKAQQRFMFAAESRGELPKGTARDWAHHTPNIKKLPQHVRNKKRQKKAAANQGLTAYAMAQGPTTYAMAQGPTTYAITARLLANLAVEKRADELGGNQLPVHEVPEHTAPAPTAPHYRQATHPGNNCASCTAFVSQGAGPAEGGQCKRFGFNAQANWVCDAFTPIQLGTDKMAAHTKKASPPQGASMAPLLTSTKGVKQPAQTQPTPPVQGDPPPAQGPGWHMGVSPSAMVASEIGGLAGQAAQLRTKIAGRHVIGDPYPADWNGGFKRVEGDSHGQAAWDSMDGFNRAYTSKTKDFMRKTAANAAAVRTYANVSGTPNVPRRSGAGDLYDAILTEKRADDMGMGMAPPDASGMDPSAQLGPPSLGAGPVPQMGGGMGGALGAGPGLSVGQGGPMTQGFPGGGAEPPQPPAGDAITQGMGAMADMMPPGGAGGDNMAMEQVPGGGMGGSDNMPKMGSLLARVAWVRTKMANWSGTENAATPGSQLVNRTPAPTVPGAPGVVPPAPPPPSGPPMAQMAAVNGPAGAAAGQRPAMPPPKSKGVYMPHQEKKSDYSVPLPVITAGGAGVGALRAPPGRRWEGAGHGALRGAGIEGGMGLGALAGGGVGGILGALAGAGIHHVGGGNPATMGDSALLGAATGAVPGALGGGVGGGIGGYKLMKNLAGPFPGSDEEKAKKPKDKEKGKGGSEKKGSVVRPTLSQMLAMMAVNGRR